MNKILITGAAGQIGNVLRKGLKGKCRLRLLDFHAIEDIVEDEESLSADLANLDALCGAMDRIHGVVHLGAVSVEDSWEQIPPSNTVSTYNVFEAARRRDARRILFASSNHAVGFTVAIRSSALT